MPQLLLLLIELFLPDIAAALGGPDSAPLRNRLLRAGLWLIVLAALLLSFHMVDLSEGISFKQLSQVSFAAVAIVLVVGFVGMGLILLSRIEPEVKLINGHEKKIEATDATATNDVHLVDAVFNRESGRRAYKCQSASWRDYMSILSGATPENVWLLEIDGVEFQVRIGILTGARLTFNNTVCDQLRRNPGFSSTSPLLSSVVSDQKGRTRKIEIFLGGTVAMKIEANVDGEPVRSCQHESSRQA